MSRLPPVRNSVIAPLRIEDTFDLFFRRMSEWWPLATRSVALRDAVSCHVEPRVGGRVYERNRNGHEEEWGTVLVWDAPSRVIFTWRPGMPESVATEVEINFTAVGAQTSVDIEHRNWEALGAMATRIRELYESGWVGVLRRFIERSTGARDLTPTEGEGCLEVIREASSRDLAARQRGSASSAGAPLSEDKP